MGYSSYFLIVSDFINWAKNSDIPVGPEEVQELDLWLRGVCLLQILIQ